MKIGLTMPVSSIHGALSKQPGIVAYVWKGIQCARTWVMPTNPNSTDQTAIRSVCTQCAQAFQSISAANKTAWAAYAATNPRFFLGKAYTIPEISAFVGINTYRLINGAAISDTPPTDTCDFVGTDITSAAFEDGGALTIIATHTAAVVTNKLWAIYVTRSMPSANRAIRDNDYRLVGGCNTTSIIAVTASPQTIVIAAPRFADWTNGDTMGVKLMGLSPEYDPGSAYAKACVITVT